MNWKLSCHQTQQLFVYFFRSKCCILIFWPFREWWWEIIGHLIISRDQHLMIYWVNLKFGLRVFWNVMEKWEYFKKWYDQNMKKKCCLTCLRIQLWVPAHSSVIIMHFKSKSNVSSHVYLISTSHRIVRFRRLLQSLFCHDFFSKCQDINVKFWEFRQVPFFIFKKIYL